MANTPQTVTSRNKEAILEAVQAASSVVFRDTFAASALTGYLASTATDFEPTEVASSIARDCYILADAMMEAREGKTATADPFSKAVALTPDQQVEVLMALSARTEVLEAILADDVDPYMESFYQYKLDITRQVLELVKK